MKAPRFLKGQDYGSVVDFTNLPEPLLTKVGLCIVTWNRVEWEVDALVATLLMPLSVYATEALMKTYSVSLKFDALLAVSADKLVRQDAREEIARVVKVGKGLSEKRNNVAHGRWYSSEDGVPGSKKDFISGTVTTEADLNKYIAAMAQLLDDLGALRTVVGTPLINFELR